MPNPYVPSSRFDRFLPPAAGYERQHVIPKELWTHPAIQGLLTDDVRQIYDPGTGLSNGQYLPRSMHHGSHPAYTTQISQNLDEILNQTWFQNLQNGTSNDAAGDRARLAETVRGITDDARIRSSGHLMDDLNPDGSTKAGGLNRYLMNASDVGVTQSRHWNPAHAATLTGDDLAAYRRETVLTHNTDLRTTPLTTVQRERAIIAKAMGPDTLVNSARDPGLRNLIDETRAQAGRLGIPIDETFNPRQLSQEALGEVASRVDRDGALSLVRWGLNNPRALGSAVLKRLLPKLIPGVNIISTAIDIYDVAKLLYDNRAEIAQFGSDVYNFYGTVIRQLTSDPVVPQGVTTTTYYSVGTPYGIELQAGRPIGRFASSDQRLFVLYYESGDDRVKAEVNQLESQGVLTWDNLGREHWSPYLNQAYDRASQIYDSLYWDPIAGGFEYSDRTMLQPDNNVVLNSEGLADFRREYNAPPPSENGDIIITGQRSRVSTITSVQSETADGPITENTARLSVGGESARPLTDSDPSFFDAEDPINLDDDAVLEITQRTVQGLNGPVLEEPKIRLITKGQVNTEISGAHIAQIFGSNLSRLFGIKNPLAARAVSVTMGELARNLFQEVDDVFGVKNTVGFDDFDVDIRNAGVGAISSIITAELIAAVGLDGLAGEAANIVVGSVVGNIATKLVAGASTANALSGAVNLSQLGNAFGGFIGSTLAAEVVNFETVGGQIGSAIGSAIGGYALGALFAKQFGALGLAAGPLGAAIGAFLGFVVGGLIGSVFGGTPRSGADAVWDEQKGEFSVANAYSKKGGSKDAAVSVATAVATSLNGVLAATGGRLTDPSAVQSGNYGMRKSDFVYRPVSTRDKDAITRRFSGDSAPVQLTNYGVWQALSDPDFTVTGGDIYAKRALNGIVAIARETGQTNENFSLTALFGDLTVARDYAFYAANSQVMNGIFALFPDNAFTIGWAATAARGLELGLNRRAASDWAGGYGSWLDMLGDGKLGGASLSADRIRQGYDQDTGERWWEIVGPNGGASYVLDGVDSAAITHIAGTEGADHIVLTHTDRPDGQFRVGGADVLASAAGLTVNGQAGSAGPLTIDVTAAIDAGGGDDEVHVGDLGNTAFGGAGNDHLFGGKLDDWLIGGEGNDRLDSGNGTIGGAPVGLGGDGNYLDGGAGNDQLHGREGSDWLEGGDGTDMLEGGDGDDILAGGGGDGDSLKGGRGDDQYLVRVGDGTGDVVDEAATATVVRATASGSINWLGDEADLFTAIARNAAAKLAGSAERFTAAVSADADDAIVFGAGIEMGDLELKRSGTETAPGADLMIKVKSSDGSFSEIAVKDWFTDPVKRIEWLKFADGNEIRIGDTVNFIVGTPGNDLIIGTEYNDFVVAGDGDDEVHLLGGDDFGSGGTGDDILFGDGDRDIIVGGLGRDTLHGGLAADMLSGDAGGDEIDGGEGDDTVSGGRGDDRLKGGTGNDVFKFSRGDGRDTIVQEEVVSTPDETLWVDMTDSYGRLTSGYSYDPDSGELIDSTGYVLREDVYYGGTRSLAWRVPLRYSGSVLQRYTGAVSTSTPSVSGSDRIAFEVGINVQDLVFDTSGPDLIIGIARENDTIASAADSADRITIRDWNGPSAPDGRPIKAMAFYQAGTVDLGSNGKVLKGGTAGDDSLAGGAGQDWITGAGGRDTLTGGDSDDILAGGGDDDRLEGQTGADVLYGGAGQDELLGGAGDDVLSGGDENDVLEGGAGADLLAGGGGDDTASYAGSSYGVTASLADSSLNADDAAGDEYDSIENLTGSASGDTLLGDLDDNVIEGGHGQDFLRGEGGDDVYVWARGDGDDIVVEGLEEVFDSAGTLKAGYTENWSYFRQWVSTGGNEHEFEVLQPEGEPTGEGHYDYYWSLAIAGPAGEEIFAGGPWVTGDGSEPPRATALATDGWRGGFARTGSGQQVARGYADATSSGSDTLEFGEGISLSHLSFEVVGADLVIGIAPDASGAGAGQITIRNHYSAGGTIETLQFNDGQAVPLSHLRLHASGQGGQDGIDDLVIGDAQDNILAGGTGNDVLVGGGGVNQLSGGAGDDLFEGGSGTDHFQGDAGTEDTVRYAGSSGGVQASLVTGAGPATGGSAAGDTFAGVENLTGSNHSDTLVGNELDNELIGLGGDNILSGNAGHDVLTALGGNDTLDGGEGDDALTGGDGTDVLTGGGGKDFLDGGAGSDSLNGGAGDDELLGGEGGGTLDGGIGNDKITGGSGAETMLGGEGADVLTGHGGGDTLLGGDGDDQYVFEAGSGTDTIVDGSGKNSVVFGGEIDRSRLWLTRDGDHLRIGVIGSNHVVKVDGFFAGTGSRVSSVQAGKHTLFLTGPKGQALIQRMTAADSTAAPGTMNAAIGTDLGLYWTEGNSGPQNIALETGTSIAVAEGTTALAAGGSAPRFVATDGEGDSFVWSMLDDAGGRFVIDAQTGALSAASGAGFDYETAASHSVTIRATDAQGASTDHIFTVAVTDLNDRPGTPVLEAGGGSVSELGAWFARFTLQDQDGTPSLQLINNPGSLFAVVGNEVRFAMGAAPDFEGLIAAGYTPVDTDGDGLSEIELSGTVRATDGIDSTDPVTVTAVIRDVNEAPTDMVLADRFAGPIAERDRLASDSGPGATTGNRPALILGKVQVADGDHVSQKGGQYTYQVFENGSTVASQRFAVVNGELQLLAGKSLDFETDGASIDIRIAATDLLLSPAFSRTFTFAIGDQIDVLGGDEGNNDPLVGQSGQDLILGYGGDDVLVGGAGPDTLDGGAGTDIASYSATSGAVSADLESKTVLADGVTDTLVSIEGVRGSAFDDTLNGSSGADVIEGGAGNDLLNGLGGADRMTGGTGNDIYVVNDVADLVIESTGQGDDSVYTAMASYTLADNAEKLFGMSTVAGQHLKDNALDNTLTGTALADWLHISAGGSDTAYGMDGNDVFFVGTALTASDRLDGGVGTDSIVFQGNTTVLLTGEMATSIENLSFRAGTDTLYGPSGVYTYNVTIADSLVAAGVQFKTNAYSLTAGETLVFDGSAETDGSFSIFAGLGRDDFKGGAKDDVFLIHTGAYQLHDRFDGGAGQDQVHFRTGITATLAATALSSIESLVLVSGGATPSAYNLTLNDGNVAAGQTLTVDGSGLTAAEGVILNAAAETDGNLVLKGGAGNDLLTSGAGSDTLEGGAGNDTLTGGAGADQMTGGAGNDLYFVEAGDTVTELANEGTDEVRTALGIYTLAANVENLTFTGTGTFKGTGNAQDNLIQGGASNDYFYLQDGGNDTVVGGAGNDWIYVRGALSAGDVFDGGVGTSDQLALQGNMTVTLTAQQMTNIEFLYAMSGTDTFGGDTSNSRYAYNITTVDANVAAGGRVTVDAWSQVAGESLVFSGSAETDGSFLIYAGAGSDNLTGGAGDDIFVFEEGRVQGGDKVVGGAGTDTLRLKGVQPIAFANEAISGIEVIQLIAGPALTSYPYSLTMYDANVAAGQSLKVEGGTLRSTESLTFNGSAELDGTFQVFGGAGNDSLTGGAGADTLTGGAGNDFMDGGAGVDSMTGGAGDDVYIADNSGDTAIELAGGGYDEVRTSAASYTLGANVEKLTATSTTVGQTLRANSGDNVVTGTAFNDWFWLMDGGADTATGGVGTDIFLMGGNLNSTDQIDGGAGTDQLGLQGNYALTIGAAMATGIESFGIMSGSDTRYGELGANRFSYALTTQDDLIGSGVQVTFNASGLLATENFTLDGSAETDGRFLVWAGLGTDTLTGGAGNDTFNFAEDRWQAADRVVGGAGTDTVMLRGNHTVTFSATALTGVETLLLASGPSRGTTFAYNLTTNDGNVAAGQMLTVDGSTLANLDSFTFNGSAETDGSFVLKGGSIGDVLTGGAGNDNIDGGAGNDVLRGIGGTDVLSGGADNDIIYGGAGNDELLGGAGNDQLYAEGDDDILDGGTGDDLMSGSTGSDKFIMRRDTGADTIENFNPSGTDRDELSIADETNPITREDLWFERVNDSGAADSSGLHMRVSVIGTGASATVRNWWPDSNGSLYRIKFFVSGAYYTQDVNVGTLVNLMTSKTKPTNVAERDAVLADSDYKAQWATVWGVNAKPVVAQLSNQVMNEDGTLSITVNATDDISPAASISMSASGIANGGIVQSLLWSNPLSNGNRTLTITPTANASGVATIRVLAVDGGGISSTAMEFSLTINGVPDMPLIPTFAGGSGTSGQAGGVALNLVLSFPDTDGSEVQEIAITGVPTGVTLSAGTFDSATNSWKLTQAQTTGLKVYAPAGWSQDLSLVVTAKATENGSTVTATKSTTVVLNAPPTNATLLGSVAENSVVGTTAGLVSGTDPDPGDTLTYTLIDSAGGRFSLNSATGALTVANGALLNFEAATSHNITVQVKDSFGQTFTKVLAVPVYNVNEANSLPATYAMNVNENVAVGTTVGTVTATDIDSSTTVFGQQRYYFWNGSAAVSTSTDGRYSIDALTGAIKTAVAMNYETMTAPASYTVIARDNAGSGSYFQAQSTVTIGVNDLNEANSLPATYAMGVNENVAVGTAVGTVAATDLDLASTANGQQRYYFYNSGAVSSVSSDSRYSIDAVTGQIKTNAALNFEAGNTSVAYTVVARDRQGVAATGVIFRDSFEELAVPTIGHKSDGGHAAMYRATNAASEGNGALRAGMWGGHHWNFPGSSFVASQSTVTVSVMVRDSGVTNASITGGWSGSNADAAAPVLLGLHNETTDAWILATNTTSTRPPNGGAWVRHVQTITGLTVGQTYTVSAMLNGWEGVRASDLDALQVEYGSVATPFVGWSQAFTTATIGINDVNEANSLPSSYSMNVNENVAVGTAIGTVAATDIDSPGVPFGQQRYYFSNNGVASATSVDGRYSIDAVTGTIKTAAAINRETMSTPVAYSVIARDNLGSGNQAATSVTIGVNDVNEANFFNASYNLSVAENVAVGTQVGTVAAFDADSAAVAFGQQRYYFWNGSAAISTTSDGRYSIDATTGAIRTAAALDYEAMSLPANYTIVARDNAGTGAYFQASTGVTIGVSNANETPNGIALQSQTFHSETLPGEVGHPGKTIATFAMSDPDGAAPSLAIIGGNGNGWFTTSGGNLNFAGANFTSDWLRNTLGQYGQESGWYHDNDYDGLKEVKVASLTLAAVDAGGLQGPAYTYNVFIEDKNETPVWNAVPYTFGLNENPASYTYVGTVAGSDPDGPTSELRYGFADWSIFYDGNIGYVSRSPDGRFLMNNQNGNVYVNGDTAMDYESGTRNFSYSTLVYDRAAGPHALARAGTLNINLQNTNDSSTWYNQVPVGFTVNENTAVGTIVSNGVRATDSDGFAITYSIDQSTNPYGAFGVNASGQIYVAGAIDHEQTGWASDSSGKYVNLRILASDGGAAAAETVKINIGNVRKYVYNNGSLDYNLYQDYHQSTSMGGSGEPGFYNDEPIGPGGGYGGGWFNEAWLVEKSTGLVISWMGEYSQWQGTMSQPFPHGASVADGYTPYGSWPNPYTLYADQEDIMTGISGVPQGNPYYPVVFDLGGDGFDLAGIKESGVTTDLNKDGLTEGSGWVKASDGLLVLDRNGDGLVLDWTEISFVKDKAGATTDLEGLVAFDSDGNLKLAAGDARFDEFRLWVDANQDGIGQAGELRSLRDAGIVSISLIREDIKPMAGSITVNSVLATAAFERADGTVGRIGDVALGRLPQRGADPEPGAPQFRFDESGVSTLAAGGAGRETKPETGGPREGRNEGTTGMEMSQTHAQSASTASAAGGQKTELLSAQNAQTQAALEPKGAELASRSFTGRRASYSLSNSGGSLFVTDNKAEGAIDGRVQEVLAGSLLSFRNGTIGLLAPVVLDLDGDGVELKRRGKSDAGFDMDGNGTRDDTGWISKQDGFLVVDLDGDGRITSPAELSLLGLKTGAKSGLDALASLDSDKNGSIDSKDSRFGELKLWVDGNGNGITDSGELQSLGDRGIASIGLGARAAADATVKIGQNAMLATSTFTRTDGSTGSVGNPALAFRVGKSAGGVQTSLRQIAAAAGVEATAASQDADRVLAERLKSLRAGLDSRPLLSLTAEGDSVFDRFARKEVAAAETGMEAETSLRRMDVPALRVPVAEEQSVQAEAASVVPAADDLRLAKMVQDMASFGLRSGEGEWKNRGQTAQKFDYFA